MTTRTAAMPCPSCGEQALEGATFCEACGHELALLIGPPCGACGETDISSDGYCLSCGQRQPRERDHLVVADGPVVAVSDRGRRHHDNEDAVAVGAVEGERPAAVLVVCDGVSSTPGSAEASKRAAVAARDVLISGLGPDRRASASADPLDDEDDPVWGLLRGAVEAAQAEASGSPDPGDGAGGPGAGGPPSSTLVAAVARPGHDRTDLAVAWVGDSRAYWVGDQDAVRLTGPDHEIEGSLTRWLGADSVEPVADLAGLAVGDTGHLVVCSDGLWRYADEPGELRALVGRLTQEGRSGAELASGLVDEANDQGGHDNITVALWSNRSDWPGTDQTVEGPTEGKR